MYKFYTYVCVVVYYYKHLAIKMLMQSKPGSTKKVGIKKI